MPAELPKRAGPVLITTALTAQAVYNGPAAGTGNFAIVRSVIVCNELDVLVKFWLGTYTSAADAAGRRFYQGVSLQGNQTFAKTPLFIPMAPGEIFFAKTDKDNGITVTLGLDVYD